MKSSDMECCGGVQQLGAYDVEFRKVDCCDIGFFIMSAGDIALAGADPAVCNMFLCDV